MANTLIFLVLAAAVALLVAAQRSTDPTAADHWDQPAGVEWIRSHVDDLVRHRLCFLLYDDVDDLGWSFRFNEARLSLAAWVAEAVGPDVALRTVVRPRARLISDTSGYIRAMIGAGCTMILANNRHLLGDEVAEAQAHPTTAFVVINDELVMRNSPQLPNLLYVGARSDRAFFVAGAAVAASSPSCVGFITAWDDQQNAYDAANAFMLGVQLVNGSVPVHVITMQNWSSPVAEVAAANVLMDTFGCSVIARYTDSRAVNQHVATRALGPSSGPRRLMSVGIHAELERYVGDSVIMSIFVDWFRPLRTAMLDWVFNRTLHSAVHIRLYDSQLSGVSPATPDAPLVTAAMHSALQLVLSRERLFCGSFTTANGTIIAHPGVPPDNCFDYFTPLGSLLRFPNSVIHRQWVRADSCPAGSRLEYATRLSDGPPGGTCVPCPVGTHASAGDGGLTECLPCPEGTAAPVEGSTSCSAIRFSPLQDSRSLALIVAGSIMIAICVAALGALAWRLQKRRRSLARAPREPPMCVIAVRIPDIVALRERMPQSTDRALHVFHRVARRVIDDADCHVLPIRPDDTILLITKDVVSAAMLSISLQRGLQRADWPAPLTPQRAELKALYNGLLASCVLRYAACGDLVAVDDPLRESVDYSGVAIQDAVDFAAIAPGGHILVTAPTLTALRASSDFAEYISPMVHLQPHGEDRTLWCMLPIELSGRHCALDVLTPVRSHFDAHQEQALGAELHTRQLGAFSAAHQDGDSPTQHHASVGTSAASHGAIALATVQRVLEELIEGIDAPSRRRDVLRLLRDGWSSDGQSRQDSSTPEHAAKASAAGETGWSWRPQKGIERRLSHSNNDAGSVQLHLAQLSGRVWEAIAKVQPRRRRVAPAAEGIEVSGGGGRGGFDVVPADASLVADCFSELRFGEEKASAIPPSATSTQ